MGTAGTRGSTTCGVSSPECLYPPRCPLLWGLLARLRVRRRIHRSTIRPATFGTCGTPCVLTMTAWLGPRRWANAYAGVATPGGYIAQASGSTTGGTIAPTGTGLTVTFTASTGGLPLRLQISSARPSGVTRSRVRVATCRTQRQDRSLGEFWHGLRETANQQHSARRAGRRGRDAQHERDAARASGRIEAESAHVAKPARLYVRGLLVRS